MSHPNLKDPIRAALHQLMTAERVQEEWFNPSVLAQVSVSQIESVLVSIKSALGLYQGLEQTGDELLAVFARGVTSVSVALDAHGRFSILAFGPPRPRATGSNLEAVLEEFRTLPGRVGILLLENGQERAAWNPDVPLAVGSTFKLAVLSALKRQIASGRHSWRDVVDLEPSWKSLPSGILHTWPDRVPLTLHTLAALMVSHSDNTAADALIHLLGREAVEAVSPRNCPFLSTREAFVLKSPDNRDLLNRYRTGGDAERRAILKEAARHTLPDPTQFADTGNLRAPDIEWFFTTRELCGLVTQVGDLPLMSINPGPIQSRDWAHIAYKGGAEPGVLNATILLNDRTEATYCLTATWNDDEPLNEVRFFLLIGSILDALKS